MRAAKLVLTAVTGCVAGTVMTAVAWADDPPADGAGAAEAEADAIPDFDQIRAPDSAALALLGVATAEIQRPTTPTELGIALGSFVSGGDLVVPDSLAVELAPYWMVSHPELTGDDMAESSVSEALLRNFTVSLGTATRTIEVGDGAGGMTDASVTDLALGLRTRWLDGRRRVSCWEDVEAAAQAIAEAQGQVIAAESVAIGARYPIRSIPERATPAETEAIEKQNRIAAEKQQAEIELVRARELEKVADRRTALAAVAAKCVAASAARTGAVGDAALAASARFPDGEFGDGEWLAAGGWVTVAAQGERHNLVGLARLLADNATGETGLLADVGARYIHVRSRYALSAELVYRHLTADVEDQDLMRVDLSVDVRIHGQSWLTATLGRDFAAPDAGEVFALTSIKWGYGGPNVALPDL